jgi:tryptophan-rich sensory protein
MVWPRHSLAPAVSAGWLAPPMLFGLMVALVVCYGAAAIGSALTFANLDPWYGRLAKPAFTPPNQLFGPAWSVLYTLMAISVWRVWGRARMTGESLSNPLGLFGLLLALNVGWTLAFFAIHSPATGLVVIVALDIALIATIAAFRERDGLAALLLAPCLGWNLFATLLTAAIWWLN